MSNFRKESYMLQRKVIGFLGILFPILLILGSWTEGIVCVGLSLSQYYHSFSRDIFVSVLIGIAGFLLYYTGHDEEDDRDKWITSAAGLLLLGVAFFPCKLSLPSINTIANVEYQYGSS